MTHPNKSKGNAAERAVVQYLRDNGYPFAGRMRSGWADDKGDIDGVPDTCVEVKAEKRISLAGYMAELEAEMANACTGTGVVIVKRRGTVSVSNWYAVAPVHVWIELLKESGR
jgi:Holliday junction resolvase